MTLIVPMHHKASAGRHGNSADMLDAHFAFVARNCRCVLHGEPLDPAGPNVCLAFDDGYFDFYAVVFPLLVKHRLRAVLAAPVSAMSTSHRFSRSRLDSPDVDLHTEIVVMQTMLAARTGRTVGSFVLPYGRFNARAIACADKRDCYLFRIGSADNAGWTGRLIHRVDADEMTSPDALFAKRRLGKYRWRRRWNAMRSR